MKTDQSGVSAWLATSLIFAIYFVLGGVLFVYPVKPWYTIGEIIFSTIGIVIGGGIIYAIPHFYGKRDILKYELISIVPGILFILLGGFILVSLII